MSKPLTAAEKDALLVTTTNYESVVPQFTKDTSDEAILAIRNPAFKFSTEEGKHNYSKD